MKLLLTSAGLTTKTIADNFLGLFTKPTSELSVLLVPYAQNAEEQFYVDQSRNELLNLGIKKVKTFNLTAEKFEGDLANYDAVYICGGNTFAILKRLRATKLAEKIALAVKSGDLVYVGVSAGSIIAGPSIAIAGWGSTGDANEVGLTDLCGLELTKIAIYPHFEETQREEVRAFEATVEYPVMTLTNEEALLIHDKTIKKI